MSENQYQKRKANSKISLLDSSYLHYKFLIPDLLGAINKYAKGRLLDVGCGNKPYESEFPNAVTEYLGCDVAQSDRKVVDVICPATDLAFEDNNFDTVFCTQVMEHVYNHKKAFFEVSRVLKKDGLLIGSVPMAWPHHEEPYDFFRFTKYGLTGLLEEAGFEIVELKANGGKWALLGQMMVLTFSGQSAQPNVFTKLKRLLFRITFSKVWIHLIFGNLDRLSSHPEYYNTLNFVFVAKKK
ncbi:MAG TPA: methyltransferase domain-containing protein [Edaphocola sp.]|nr:methyltransferase domain-containing protein [Edaphocola sp.]